MKLKVIAGPKAHIGKVVNTGEFYTKQTGLNEHGEFIRFDYKSPIEFAKQSGSKKDYYVEVTEYGNHVIELVLQPIRGNRIKLQVKVID